MLKKRTKMNSMQNQTETLKIGLVVYVMVDNIQNTTRQNKIIETEVTTIGSKYFQVKHRGLKFDKNTLRTNAQIGDYYKVYLSEQDYLEETEKNFLLDEIRREISKYDFNVSLEEIRTIHRIISSKDKQ